MFAIELYISDETSQHRERMLGLQKIENLVLESFERRFPTVLDDLFSIAGLGAEIY